LLLHAATGLNTLRSLFLRKYNVCYSSISQLYYAVLFSTNADDYWSLYQVVSGASPTGYMRSIARHKNYCGFSLSVPNFVHHF
jgi:hypothetical protein